MTDQIGTIRMYNSEKGYGFLRPDEVGPDTFCHVSAFKAAGIEEPTRGERFLYAINMNPKTGKPQACNIRREHDIDGDVEEADGNI
jgi:CspA family cold shock protein